MDLPSQLEPYVDTYLDNAVVTTVTQGLVDPGGKVKIWTGRMRHDLDTYTLTVDGITQSFVNQLGGIILWRAQEDGGWVADEMTKNDTTHAISDRLKSVPKVRELAQQAYDRYNEVGYLKRLLEARERHWAGGFLGPIEKLLELGWDANRLNTVFGRLVVSAIAERDRKAAQPTPSLNDVFSSWGEQNNKADLEAKGRWFEHLRGLVSKGEYLPHEWAWSYDGSKLRGESLRDGSYNFWPMTEEEAVAFCVEFGVRRYTRAWDSYGRDSKPDVKQDEWWYPDGDPRITDNVKIKGGLSKLVLVKAQ